MKITNIIELAIPEIKVYTFALYPDNRGYFTECFRESDMGLKITQMNEAVSNPNVLRGLHFQWNPHMGKLVRTINGHMVDYVLDIRKNSPTFGKIISYDMPELKQYGEWIYIPPGFAHGSYFIEKSRIQYLCTGEYNPVCEYGISFFDKQINWDLSKHKLIQFNPIVSEKDRNNHTLEDWISHEAINYFL
jgi:dTDP-4-dehydrorhamnose 3,5-epimerase